MKIRNGFVSNSSSSSFFVYGTEITREDLNNSPFWDENLQELSGEFRDLQVGADDYSVVIGLPPSDGDDSETFGQFKHRVKDRIEKVLGRPAECDFVSLIVYD